MKEFSFVRKMRRSHDTYLKININNMKWFLEKDIDNKFMITNINLN